MAWRLFFPCTLRTQSLGHIVDAMELVALGKMNSRNGSLGYAERALAPFAEEVYMLVVVVLMSVVAVAQLVAYTVGTILDDMHQMVLAEQRQSPEYARLVNGQDLILQFR